MPIGSPPSLTRRAECEQHAIEPAHRVIRCRQHFLAAIADRPARDRNRHVLLHQSGKSAEGAAAAHALAILVEVIGAVWSVGIGIAKVDSETMQRFVVEADELEVLAAQRLFVELLLGIPECMEEIRLVVIGGHDDCDEIAIRIEDEARCRETR